MALESIAAAIVDSGLKIHKLLGPGLLESIYEACLEQELQTRGLECQRQVSLPIIYEGVTLESAHRADLIVAEAIILEIKAVESLSSLHQAQLLTYMKLTGLKLGFLLNFNVPLFRDGIRRFVNRL
jgi:GxxExxY protein